MNNCDCREFDEFWKNDLQRHDRDVHENQNAVMKRNAESRNDQREKTLDKHHSR
jgi:hypothetical protein